MDAVDETQTTAEVPAGCLDDSTVLRFVSVRRPEGAPPAPPRQAKREREREDAEFGGREFEGPGEGEV